MTMPRPDGWDVLRRLRGADGPGERIPVVACLERPIDRAKAFRSGADHYVLKPVAPDELLRRVAAIVPRPAAPAHRPIDGAGNLRTTALRAFDEAESGEVLSRLG